MRLKRPTIIDGRGDVRPAYQGLWRGFGSPNPRAPKDVRKLARRAWRDVGVNWWMAAFSILASALAGALFVFGSVYAAAAAVALTLVPVWLSDRRIKAFDIPTSPLFIERMLAADRCASCAGKIDAWSQESDGCVVCPACGAAWLFVTPGDPAAMPTPSPYTISPSHTTMSTGSPPNS